MFASIEFSFILYRKNKTKDVNCSLFVCARKKCSTDNCGICLYKIIQKSMRHVVELIIPLWKYIHIDKKCYGFFLYFKTWLKHEVAAINSIIHLFSSNNCEKIRTKINQSQILG